MDHRKRRRTCAAFVFALAATMGACASTGGSAEGGGSSSMLTREQLLETHEPNLYSAVQRLKPNWLRARGNQIAAGGGSTNEVQLFVDGAHRGAVSDLRSIPIESVIELRFYTASEAGFTFGTLGGNAGVLEVRTRR